MDRFYVKRLLMILFLASISINYLNAQVTNTIHIKAKWNMVSLPVKVQDAYYLTLFPGAIYQPWSYDPPNETDTLRIGRAYWMLFASDTTYLVTGEPIQSTIRDVWAGWNMVGSISEPIPLSNIHSDPPGIIISDLFEYNATSGYEKTDTIIPGSGYWVKVNQPGEIILSSIGYPCSGIHTVNYAEKIYNTVQIGDQCWLRENLDIGVAIQSVDTSTNNGIIEKYCYENDHFNCIMSGGLYQWNEAMQYTTTPGARGICPPGWHIPTYAEFQTLSNTVGGDGNALKEIGQGTGGGAGTNTSGFSALLAGYRDNYGPFLNLSNYTAFWSSTEYYSSFAYSMTLSYDISDIFLYYSSTDYGFSIRCLKD